VVSADARFDDGRGGSPSSELNIELIFPRLTTARGHALRQLFGSVPERHEGCELFTVGSVDLRGGSKATMPKQVKIPSEFSVPLTEVVISDRQLAAWQVQQRELERIEQRRTAPRQLWVEALGRHFLLVKARNEDVQS
jgi:hypothetical protein